MNPITLLVATLIRKENVKIAASISALILLVLSACSPAAIPAAAVEAQPTSVQVLATPTIESTQPPTSTPEATEEPVYPSYLPLATKPDIAPQTINGVTMEIDWAYVDESRLALHYTISGLDWPDGTPSYDIPVRITSATVSDIGYGGNGGFSSYVDHGMITGSSDQFFADGALNAEKHPSIDLSVDIPVEGPSTVGTFHFEFNMPVVDGIKMENLDQTVVANNVSMTLKALALNPSRAEALICFQMPSAVDWGLTASTITVSGQEYPFVAGGGVPGSDSKSFSLTDPERCNTVSFDIPYDESATSITLTVPKLMASVPEVIEKERVEAANKRLAGTDIEFDYENVDHGGNIVILKRPDGKTDEQIYPLIWDALAEQYAGPWIFTVAIER